MSIGISGGGGNSSCQSRTPYNPTEVKAIATVTVVVNAPVHTTVKCGVTFRTETYNIVTSDNNNGIAST